MREIANVLRETRIVIKKGHFEFHGAISIIAALLILFFAKDLIPLIFHT